MHRISISSLTKASVLDVKNVIATGKNQSDHHQVIHISCIKDKRFPPHVKKAWGQQWGLKDGRRKVVKTSSGRGFGENGWHDSALKWRTWKQSGRLWPFQADKLEFSCDALQCFLKTLSKKWRKSICPILIYSIFLMKMPYRNENVYLQCFLVRIYSSSPQAQNCISTIIIIVFHDKEMWGELSLRAFSAKQSWFLSVTF